jgi:hypothetical protein
MAPFVRPLAACAAIAALSTGCRPPEARPDAETGADGASVEASGPGPLLGSGNFDLDRAGEFERQFSLLARAHAPLAFLWSLFPVE